MAACDDKRKDKQKSLHISILGDIFKSADNCRLPIIVEGALTQRYCIEAGTCQFSQKYL